MSDPCSFLSAGSEPLKFWLFPTFKILFFSPPNYYLALKEQQEETKYLYLYFPLGCLWWRNGCVCVISKAAAGGTQGEDLVVDLALVGGTDALGGLLQPKWFSDPTFVPYKSLKGRGEGPKVFEGVTSASWGCWWHKKHLKDLSAGWHQLQQHFGGHRAGKYLYFQLTCPSQKMDEGILKIKIPKSLLNRIKLPRKVWVPAVLRLKLFWTFGGRDCFAPCFCSLEGIWVTSRLGFGSIVHIPLASSAFGISLSPSMKFSSGLLLISFSGLKGEKC